MISIYSLNDKNKFQRVDGLPNPLTEVQAETVQKQILAGHGLAWIVYNNTITE